MNFKVMMIIWHISYACHMNCICTSFLEKYTHRAMQFMTRIWHSSYEQHMCYICMSFLSQIHTQSYAFYEWNMISVIWTKYHINIGFINSIKCTLEYSSYDINMKVYMWCTYDCHMYVILQITTHLELFIVWYENASFHVSCRWRSCSLHCRIS